MPEYLYRLGLLLSGPGPILPGAGKSGHFRLLWFPGSFFLLGFCRVVIDYFSCLQSKSLNLVFCLGSAIVRGVVSGDCPIARTLYLISLAPFFFYT